MVVLRLYEHNVLTCEGPWLEGNALWHFSGIFRAAERNLFEGHGRVPCHVEVYGEIISAPRKF